MGINYNIEKKIVQLVFNIISQEFNANVFEAPGASQLIYIHMSSVQPRLIHLNPLNTELDTVENIPKEILTIYLNNKPCYYSVHIKPGELKKFTYDTYLHYLHNIVTTFTKKLISAIKFRALVQFLRNETCDYIEKPIIVLRLNLVINASTDELVDILGIIGYYGHLFNTNNSLFSELREKCALCPIRLSCVLNQQQIEEEDYLRSKCLILKDD